MQSETLAVSIIMPLFNKEAEVGRSVRSVLAQTFHDYELIVIDDGSTDRGPEIIRNLNSPRIRMIVQENAGVSAARNRGIAEARADLIAFLDADDEWRPDFLESILLLRKQFTSCKVFATGYFFCFPEGQQRPAILHGLPQGFTEGVMGNYFGVASRSEPPLWTSATAVEKEAIEGVGGFPIGVASGEDLLTWARLAVRYEIAYLCEPKAYFWGPMNVSDRPGRVPKEPDFVGSELAKLMETAGPARAGGLRQYISLWHRMRATIFIQLGERRKAVEELRTAAGYSGTGLKLFVLGLLARMPGRLSARALKFLKRMNHKVVYRRT